MGEGISSYRDLRVYQLGYELALAVHRLTRTFPPFERRELGYQLRRAAVSIPANIAEGYGRRTAEAEFRHFLRNALGSANEVSVLLHLAQDLGYMDGDALKLLEQYEQLGKQLYTLMRRWKTTP